MGDRLDFHIFLQALTNVPSGNIYYQPPDETDLSYPCVVYERSHIRSKVANNCVYLVQTVYTVTYIYVDPDDDLPNVIADYPGSRHDRHFVFDGLYHDVFSIHLIKGV